MEPMGRPGDTTEPLLLQQLGLPSNEQLSYLKHLLSHRQFLLLEITSMTLTSPHLSFELQLLLEDTPGYSTGSTIRRY